MHKGRCDNIVQFVSNKSAVKTHAHTHREHKPSDDGQPDLQSATATEADGSDVGRGGVSKQKGAVDCV